MDNGKKDVSFLAIGDLRPFVFLNQSSNEVIEQIRPFLYVELTKLSLN